MANRLVVITGAGSGLGRATAERFARRSDTVIVSDINLDGANETVELIRKRGGTAHAYRVDVTDVENMEKFAGEVREWHGVPDIVVNNAGFTTAGTFMQHEPEDWERLMNVNVYGVITGCRLFARQMIEAGKPGHIMNVASGIAFAPVLLSPAYCTTKSAVVMLSQCLRAELAPHRIKVTAICPGFMQSNFYTSAQHVGVDEQEREHRAGLISGALRFAPRTPNYCARAIVREARFKRAVAPVGPESYLGYAAHRISPGAVRFAARFTDPNQIAGLLDRYVPARVQQFVAKDGAK